MSNVQGKAPGVWTVDARPTGVSLVSESMSGLALIGRVSFGATGAGTNQPYTSFKAFVDDNPDLAGIWWALQAAGPIVATGTKDKPAAISIDPVAWGSASKRLETEFDAVFARALGWTVDALSAMTLPVPPVPLEGAPAGQGRARRGGQPGDPLREDAPAETVGKARRIVGLQVDLGWALATASALRASIAPGTKTDEAVADLINSSFSSVAEKPCPSGILGQLALTVWSVGGFFANGGSRLWVLDADPATPLAWKEKLEEVAGVEREAGLLAVPGGGKAAWQPIKEFCGRTDLGHSSGEPYCFGLLDADSAKETPSQGGSTGDSRTAAFGPWVKMGETLPAGRRKGSDILIPPSALVAGVIARTDGEHGPHHAAAGNDAVLNGSLCPSESWSTADVGVNNAKSLNCLVRFPGEDATLVWGTRTLSNEIPYRYITTSRLLMMIRRTTKKQMRRVVFKPNSVQLQKQLDRDIRAYLRGMQRKEQIADFNVTCDATNNTDQTMSRGELHVRIEVKPLMPAEFVVVEVAQMQLAQ